MRDCKGEAGSSSQHIVSPESRALHECRSSLLDIAAGRSPPSHAATGNAYASNSITAGRPGSCSSVRSMRSSAALSEVPSSRLAPANGWYASPVLGSYSEVYRRSFTPYSAFKEHHQHSHQRSTHLPASTWLGDHEITNACAIDEGDASPSTSTLPMMTRSTSCGT